MEKRFYVPDLSQKAVSISGSKRGSEFSGWGFSIFTPKHFRDDSLSTEGLPTTCAWSAEHPKCSADIFERANNS